MISSSEAFKFWIKKYVVIFPFPFTWISPLSIISNPWFSRALHKGKINAPDFKEHRSVMGELATGIDNERGEVWGLGHTMEEWDSETSVGPAKAGKEAGGERRKAWVQTSEQGAKRRGRAQGSHQRPDHHLFSLYYMAHTCSPHTSTTTSQCLCVYHLRWFWNKMSPLLSIFFKSPYTPGCHHAHPNYPSYSLISDCQGTQEEDKKGTMKRDKVVEKL